MLESSVFLENSGGGGGISSEGVKNEGGGGGGENSGAASRWPREETLALLKIRSDMDIAFRDTVVKAPLWDEVSRKLGELGYNRSAKKCKEKFENIYKYHKRTKDGRTNRQDGKSYRFFEQLEHFDTNQFATPSTPLNQVPSFAMETPALSTAVVAKPINQYRDFTLPAEFMSASTSAGSSSGKESEEGNVKKRRKLADYFERLMKDVLDKQEDLQTKFLEAIEKCENDRIAREEAWRVQEMARIKREQEFLAQERAIAAQKDAAVLAFLQKITQQPLPSDFLTIFDEASAKQELVFEKRAYSQENGAGETSTQIVKRDNTRGENTTNQMSSVRWPKAEIEALIKLKTDLDIKYLDNGPKGPLWEEISTCMKKLGYDRSAKRCKEKWENINKYYKRVKDSKKKRSGDSKTCPYFDKLESLYANKSKKIEASPDNGGCNLKPEQILMQMMSQFHQQHQPEQSTGEYGDNDHHDREEDDFEDGDSGDDYQIAANNLSSMTALS